MGWAGGVGTSVFWWCWTGLLTLDLTVLECGFRGLHWVLSPMKVDIYIFPRPLSHAMDSLATSEVVCRTAEWASPWSLSKRSTVRPRPRCTESESTFYQVCRLIDASAHCSFSFRSYSMGSLPLPCFSNETKPADQWVKQKTLETYLSRGVLWIIGSLGCGKNTECPSMSVCPSSLSSELLDALWEGFEV